MRRSISFLIPLLLFPAALPPESVQGADKFSCVQALCRSFDAEKVARQVNKYRQSIIDGYHLPTNYTSGYYARRIEPRLSRPNYPEVKSLQVLYRGMFVSLDELLIILREGLKFSKVTWIAVGGKGVSFSSDLNEAKTYIFMNADARPGGIGVVFKVDKKDYIVPVEESVNNPTRTIFKSRQDVPPQDFREVYLWGEYGLEDIQDIIKKAQKKEIKLHKAWTGVFDSSR